MKRTRRLFIAVSAVVGLLLGGPISAVLSSICFYILFRFFSGQHSSPSSSAWDGFLESLLLWIAIGSVAMPLSWFAANSIGWNFDVVALLQSKGVHKSYKDWSEAEERLRSLNREMRRLESERRREEQRRVDAERRAQEEEQTRLEEARLQAEERRQQQAVRKELEYLNDPNQLREREEAHRRFLYSINCIDANGNVIRDMFCLNAEDPSRR